MARIIARHALEVQHGNNVLIDALDDCEELIIAVVEAVTDEGAR